VEHDKEVELVSTARFKIDHIHDTIRLLQQVERSFVLLALNKPIRTVVEFGEDDWDLILGDPELLIVMLVEGVILVQRARCLIGACSVCRLLGSTYGCWSGTSYRCTCPYADFLTVGATRPSLVGIALFVSTTRHGLSFRVRGHAVRIY